MTTVFDERFLDAKLLTNEWAYRNKTSPNAVLSPTWDVTSGSLYQTRLGAWSGIPDGVSPDATSSNGTGSAVFRMISKRTYSAAVATYEIELTINNRGLTSTSRTPPVAWDGLHIFLGYQDPDNLYALTINRRDNTAIIKKKAGGVYTELFAPQGFTVDYDAFEPFVVRHYYNGDIRLGLPNGQFVWTNDTTFQSGRIGLRADNCEFLLSRFKVESL